MPAQPQRGFDGIGIETAYIMIQSERTEEGGLARKSVHIQCALGGAAIMIFDDGAVHARRHDGTGHVHVITYAIDDIGSGMNMHIQSMMQMFKNVQTGRCHFMRSDIQVYETVTKKGLGTSLT